MNALMMVHDFMKKHRQPVSPYPMLVNKELSDFRCDLILEEFRELELAVEKGDVYQIADALADILYVTYGAALTFGIPIDTCLDLVHQSNMSKDVKVDREGHIKVEKGYNYKPPKIRPFIDMCIRVGKGKEEANNGR